jgi:hypothetical protein
MLIADQSRFFDSQIEEQNEIADHIFGMVARRDGEPLDYTKSAAWQRGWVEAKVHRYKKMPPLLEAEWTPFRVLRRADS